jgi:hypothetical protein
MKSETRLTIIPRHAETRILMTEGTDDLLVAKLSPVTGPHHRWAAPMLIEALSLWQGSPVRVVMSADAEDYLYPLGLGDGLGLGASNARYAVDIVDARARRPTRRLRGLGELRDARAQLRLVWSR